MSAPPPSARTLLLLGALLVACNPVDPREGLEPLSDACIPDGQCADGFVCVGTKCHLRAGEACNDAFAWQPCEYTLGVCSGAQRSCVNGHLEALCPTSGYGPDYQAGQETACDGLDNDCDGFADQARAVTVAGLVPTGVVLRGGITRVVPFGSGFLAVTVTRAGNNLNAVASVRARALDTRLQPLEGGSELIISSGSFVVPRLQVVPFPQGALVLWSQGPGGQELPQLARLDVGDGNTPVLGLGPRAPPIPVQDPFVRAALSADSQRLLIAWREGQLRGQLFSRDLEPLAPPRQLSAPLGDEGPTAVGSADLMDVAADAESGFVAGWTVSSAAEPPLAPTQPLRVARFSSSLELVGTVVGTASGPATFPSNATLRVLGARSAAEQPTVAWTSIPAGTSAIHLQHARPFVPGSAPSAPRSTGGSGGLELVAGEAGTALLFFPRVTGGGFNFNQTLALRSIALDNGAAERNLGLASAGDPGANVFAGLLDMPWTVTISAATGGLQYVTTCSL